jgi:predicted nucleic acid-binding protein
VILDSTVAIAGERQGLTVRAILEQIQTAFANTEIGLSVVTVVELTHGIYRSKLEDRRIRRQAFVDELLRDVPIYPVTVDVARIAGRIEGEQAGRGLSVAFEDLLIAATAMQLGYGVATSNVRHFEMIPGLRVFHF